MILRYVWNLFSISALLFIAMASVAAQTPINIDAVEAQKHLTAHVDPVYPAIAKAAAVQGEVKISVVIDGAGQVASEKVVSGPPMLQQAALDAVKKWRFTPFEVNGTATQTTTTLTIPFYLEKRDGGPTPDQEKAAQAWFPLSDKCRSALKAQNTQDSLDYCKQALEMALKAGDLSSSDQLAMLESYQSYGHALLAAGRLQEALAAEDKAVDVAKAHLKDTDQEYAMPFYWRAIAEAQLGHGETASADLTIAEETHRKAITHLPEMKKTYSQYLAAILKQHAALLDQMGKTADAAKLREEASSL
jgi:TonB family protein